MTKIEDSDGLKITLDDGVDIAAVRALRKHGPIDRLWLGILDRKGTITARIAREITRLKSVRRLTLWASATRTAMTSAMRTPGLESLDVLRLRHPGKLPDCSDIKGLRVVRCQFGITDADVAALSRLPDLVEFGLPNSEISPAAIESLLAMPRLKSVNLEGSKSTDDVAARLAQSGAIEDLSIGSTAVTVKGLREICRMKQLRELDIWALDIQEHDLELLWQLPNLEYVSIGGHDGQKVLTAEGVLPRLEGLPALRQLWLDGIVLSDAQQAELRERYEYAHITFVDED